MESDSTKGYSIKWHSTRTRATVEIELEAEEGGSRTISECEELMRQAIKNIGAQRRILGALTLRSSETHAGGGGAMVPVTVVFFLAEE